MSDEPPYTGPCFSRHIAELVGLPLDDPDVIAAIAAAESDDAPPEETIKYPGRTFGQVSPGRVD